MAGLQALPQRGRVRVANPADGGFIYWLLKYYAFGVLVLLVIATASAPVVVLAVSADVPAVPRIDRYPSYAALPTSVFSADGTRLTELAAEQRKLVSYESLPPLLIKAFVAAEDRAFFEHGGIDIRGILRAAWANLRAGGVAQGGSTLTQQVAKAHLSPERTIQRKLKELVLARRLEAAFSKEQILTFYLNQVFFGSQAYGVQAAAAEYFGKDINQLSLGEIALLAGLVRAPSRYSPRRNIERATRRRNTILSTMRGAGFIDEGTMGKAQGEKIHLAPQRRGDPLPLTAPHFAGWARHLLLQRYGRERVERAGWTVSTTIDLVTNAIARNHTLASVEALDKRQGYRGPIRRLRSLDERRQAVARLTLLYGALSTLQKDRPYVALVTRVSPKRAIARIAKRTVEIPLALMSWAAPYQRWSGENGRTIESAKEALAPGDLIWVTSPPSWMRRKHWGQPQDRRPTMALDQRPIAEGALFAYDHQSGYVKAMIGGLDYDRSNYNRVVQACRQPGSAFKPLYYSLALDSPKWSMGATLQDKPYTPEAGETWSPKNVDGSLDGKISMHFALVKSKNLASLDLFFQLAPPGCREKRGVCAAQAVARWARRLGITTPIVEDKGLALGTSCVKMDELTRAYGTFVRGGTAKSPVYIRQVRDRQGVVIEDHSDRSDPDLSEDERIDRIWAATLPAPKQTISKTTSFLITKLLRDSVLHGIAARCQIVPAPVGGKGGSTGTYKKTDNVWFVGFTSRWVGAGWIGEDKRIRSLGDKEASYTSVIPMYANFLREALTGHPHSELPLYRPQDVDSAEIDFQLGGAPQPGRKSVRIQFRRGSYNPAATPLSAKHVVGPS